MVFGIMNVKAANNIVIIKEQKPYLSEKNQTE